MLANVIRATAMVLARIVLTQGNPTAPHKADVSCEYLRPQFLLHV